jgi:triacylglycerol lipase
MFCAGTRPKAGCPAMRDLRNEARALARQGKLIAKNLWRGPRPVAGERVAIFVHGFLAAGPVFDPLRDHVGDHCSVDTLDFTYGPFLAFDEIARRFDTYVRERVPAHVRISLVGHSLGGLIARWWLQELDGAARVDRIVTMATPHAGTRSARFGFGPLARALTPGSEVISRLAAGRHRAAGIPHTAIVAGRDRMVTPPASAAQLDDATVIWFDELGHNAMLYDTRVHDAVARLLGDPGR